jgi:GNAT superfamily N-acetyltransferase
MRIAEIAGPHFEDWIDLRQALWPKEVRAHLVEDATRTLADPNQVGFLASDADGRPIGFIEAALYRDADARRPRAHVEAWYVVPEHRGQGYGGALLGHVQHWCLHRAVTLLTSDTHSEYPLSPPAHEACGFERLGELQIFVKELTG